MLNNSCNDFSEYCIWIKWYFEILEYEITTHNLHTEPYSNCHASEDWKILKKKIIQTQAERTHCQL